MSGIFAVLDDVAALAKLAAASLDDVTGAAAKASAKSAGVVIDDAAVTPQYVQGLAAERELPIIKRIAFGSLRNKFLLILPVALVLSQYLPGLLTPLLMLGGTYLCFEGFEKVWSKFRGHQHDNHTGALEANEDHIVSSAVRTDLILSAEIMVISLNQVADESLLSRAVIMALIAVLMTVVVYGAVGLIVKMDDIGLSLVQAGRRVRTRVGSALVAAMPRVLTTLTVVGTAAMLWVGGHIWLVGTHDLGFAPIYDVVHHLEDSAQHALGGVGAWLINTTASAILGAVVGATAAALLSSMKSLRSMTN